MAKETHQEIILRLACERLEEYGVTLTQEEKADLLNLNTYVMNQVLNKRLQAAKIALRGWY